MGNKSVVVVCTIPSIKDCPSTKNSVGCPTGIRSKPAPDAPIWRGGDDFGDESCFCGNCCCWGGEEEEVVEVLIKRQRNGEPGTYFKEIIVWEIRKNC